MPHQCLGCGHAFDEGSSALLAGCPKCKGTKFFYSAKPIDENERRQLQETAQDDLRSVVQNVLSEASPAAAKEMQEQASAGGGWAELTPKQLRRIVRQVQSEQKESEPIPPVTSPLPRSADEAPVDSPKRLKEARKVRDDIIAEFSALDEESQPDTVNVKGEGQYGVDLKGLLEKDPIVVHKDGAYMIHLPSLFDKKRES